MARQSRIHVPGGVYHVMLRGNGGQVIFPDGDDGAAFLNLLAEGVARFGFRCHGYCLMPNHAHLVLQAGAEPLSRAMQNLSFRYTRHINGRERRMGHLFQGRYKAILVDGDAYLLELVRYVHLNPVRARGLVGLIARETGAASLAEIARRFGRDPTSLSRVLANLEAAAARDSALAERIEGLNNTLIQA